MKKYTKNDSVFINGVDFHVQFMTFKYEPVHTHDFYEFVYVLSGELMNKVDDTEYILSEGSLLFVNIGQKHELYAKGNVKYVNILISTAFVEKEIQKQKAVADAFSRIAFIGFLSENAKFQAVKFDEREKAEIERFIYDMLEEYNNFSANYEKIFTYDFFVILLKLSRKTFKYSFGNSIKVVNKKMSEIAEYIDLNYGAKLTMKEVAERFFYNSAYFSRMFKQVFGTTFKNYLQNARVKAAMYIIINTDYSFEKIANLVGYDDKKQFYYVFKKCSGMTPGEFRKQNLIIRNVKG